MTGISWKRGKAERAIHGSGSSHAFPDPTPGSGKGTFMLLFWLAGAIMIFALLYSASHIALHSLPKHPGMNMRSLLTADYSVWEELEFQPVDPAILEEIQLERGLPGQLIIDAPTWTTPAASLPSSSLTDVTDGSTPQATSGQPSIDPTEIQPSITSTPIPTDTDLQPQTTETPPVSQPRPTKTRKPHKTPKPPKPGKPDITH
jgi:hypothetical protein